jgi:hypothetical protein
VVLVAQLPVVAREPEIGDRDAEAVARQRARRGGTDPVVAPGDEGDAAARQP